MKILMFFTILLSTFCFQAFASKIDLKVYNLNSKEHLKANFKFHKIEKLTERYELEAEANEKKLSDKRSSKPNKKPKIKKVYLDYLWILILPLFIFLYFMLTKIAEKFLFMPFDPYEKYKNSLNFLLRKNKKNKYKIIAIFQNFKNYLQEKIGIDSSKEDLLTKLDKFGIERKAIMDIFNKIEEIKHPSYNLKDEDVNELLDSMENVISEIEQKDEDVI